MSPFPWLPMLAIATGLISHSYCLSSLFPYVGYMVQHIGVTDDKDEAGELLALSSAVLFLFFLRRFYFGILGVISVACCSSFCLAHISGNQNE